MRTLRHAALATEPWTGIRGLAVIATVALLVHAPSLCDVGVRNLDFNAHYHWAVQFAEGLRHGDPYPRWMWRDDFGSGEPSLLFYSPLFYYLTAFVRLLTNNTWAAMRIVFVASTLLTGVISWRTLRPFTGEWCALCGAALLQAAPMVFMLFYYFNGFPWASSFAALVMLACAMLRSDALQHRVDVRVAFSIAALVLTHVVAALMALICFSAVCLCHVRRTTAGWAVDRGVASWLVSVGCGLALAMVYLLPALALMHEISPEVWTRDYTPWNAFAFPTITAFAFGFRWFTFQWPVPLVALLAVLFATVYAWRREDSQDAFGRALRLLLVISWVSIFLASELSYPLWLIPSPLRDVQFPHRFIYITSATGLIADLLCVKEILRSRGVGTLALVGIAPLLLGLGLTTALSAKLILDGKPLALEIDENGPFSGLAEYRLRTRGPDWNRYEGRGGFDAECRAHSLTCQQLDASSNRQAWQISGDRQALIRLPVFAFSAWRVTRDGLDASSSVDPSTGLILVAVPPGRHSIAVTWVRLGVERTGAAASLIALLFLALIAARQRRPA